MLRNSASGVVNRHSGPDFGRTATGKTPKAASSWTKAGHRSDFGVSAVAVRPRPGREGRFPGRDHYCITQSPKVKVLSYRSRGRFGPEPSSKRRGKSWGIGPTNRPGLFWVLCVSYASYRDCFLMFVRSQLPNPIVLRTALHTRCQASTPTGTHNAKQAPQLVGLQTPGC